MCIRDRNKPRSAAGWSEDNAQGWNIVRKMKSWPKSRRRLWNFEDNLSAEGIIFRYTRKSEGVYLFYNPPNNFSRRTQEDRYRSRKFCEFSRFSQCGIVNQLFNFSVTGLCKKYFFCFPWPIKSLASTLCSFLGLNSVEVKSDDGYQIGRWISSDNHRPILYHVISFMQSQPEEIIRWVIRADNLCPASQWKCWNSNIRSSVFNSVL